jgi:hydroxylamine reductase
VFIIAQTTRYPMEELEMFCNQCEQTQGTACRVEGACGKLPEVAALQDLLTYALRGLSHRAIAAREAGIPDPEADRFTVKALFATLTNVDFDPLRLEELIRRAAALRDRLREATRGPGEEQLDDAAASFVPAPDLEGLIEQGAASGLPIDRTRPKDVQSLQEMTLYGLRGVAAYADHAAILGQEDPDVYAFIQETLVKTADDSLGLEDWVSLALETGRTNMRAMELLDAGNTGAYGHPVPTEVPLGHEPGKAVLISGHDLKDLEQLLAQTEGLDLHVYTHGEMLPAHAYPFFKKHDHFRGHYGTAWQNQRTEFATFPGAILLTTNCLMPPEDSYRDRLFTTGQVAFPGIPHVQRDDLGPVIEKALASDGFTDRSEAGTVWVGYGRNTILQDHPMGSVKDTLLAYVDAGTIRRFILVGGCDGDKPGRNYYTEFVEQAPSDTVILTLACGKFRFFDKELGAIDGVPRLVDVGQCNDAYSAIRIAMALSEAKGVGLNDLPLSLVLSWYEQKAVAILLTLFHLGFKDIRLGPSLPAFVTPRILDLLQERFDVKPTTTPADDLAAILSE